MSWSLRFSSAAARAATMEDKDWRLHHPENIDGFDAAYDAALDAISAAPMGDQRVVTRQFKGARRYVIQSTGHVIFYRVNESGKYVIVLNIFPGRLLKETSV